MQPGSSGHDHGRDSICCRENFLISPRGLDVAAIRCRFQSNLDLTTCQRVAGLHRFASAPTPTWARYTPPADTPTALRAKIAPLCDHRSEMIAVQMPVSCPHGQSVMQTHRNWTIIIIVIGERIATRPSGTDERI